MEQKDIEKKLKGMFTKCFYELPKSIKRITGGVSGRIIYKLKSANYVCIGVHNAGLPENDAFIEFSKRFRNAGLKVPQIYCVSDSREYYLEEFLGDKSLFELTKNNSLCEKDKIRLYKKALTDLIEFQIKGRNIINFKYCYETKEFNRKQIYFDIEKFSKYFLSKLTNLNYSKDKFSSVKKLILSELSKERNSFFMYRDFQPRNIIYNDGELSYIDYQSGRKGPLQYDAASFLFSGSIEITESQRKLLLDYYIKNVSKQIRINSAKFRKSFYNFAFIRLIQVLGSYGYLYENKKEKKTERKIKKAAENLKGLIKYLGNKTLIDFAKELSEGAIRISKNR